MHHAVAVKAAVQVKAAVSVAAAAAAAAAAGVEAPSAITLIGSSHLGAVIVQVAAIARRRLGAEMTQQLCLQARRLR